MFKLKPLISNLWYGCDDSYAAVLNAQTRLADLQAKGDDAVKTAIKMAGGKSNDPWALPPLWEVQNGVAVINISGSLINGSAGFMRLFGAIGYTDIADALTEAMASKDAKSILLAIDSGGGAVNGLEDIGNLIRQADALKPVISFTDGDMGSAAYWLGASGRKVFSTKTAQVGSVGTLIVHTEHSKQLADAGIKKTIIKYGKYKAFGNPFEPLSDESKEQIQALADEAGGIFVDYVAGRRGVTAEKFQKTMGEGRVFMGRQAHDVGLTDGVMSYSDVVTFAKTLDNQNTPPHNPRKSSKDSSMKLSKKILLAIAAGAKLEALGLSALDANVEGAQLDAAGIAALSAEASELIAARDAAGATAVTAAIGTKEAELTAAKTDLKAATDKVALLEAGSAGLNAKVAASNEVAAGCSSIVKASMSVMSVALGGAADVGAALSGAELVAAHTALAETFAKKFPGGQVSAVTTELKKPEASTGPSAQFLAFMGAGKK
jgi:signal peptide peptidase SppA